MRIHFAKHKLLLNGETPSRVYLGQAELAQLRDYCERYITKIELDSDPKQVSQTKFMGLEVFEVAERSHFKVL